MDRSAKHPCKHFGCRKLLAKSGYCEKHKPVITAIKKAAFDPDYVERNRFYQRVSWKRTRLAQLQREPLCRKCRAVNKLSEATIVDHIKPIAMGGDKYAYENLQSLCASCHNRKTRVDTNK